MAILSEQDPFSNEVAAGAATYARQRGLAVVYSESYPSNTQDVGPFLRTIKGVRPDVLLGSGHLQDSLMIVRQAKAVGLAPKAVGFSVGPSAPEFRRNLQADADGILGPTQWTSALKYNGSDLWHTPQAFAAAFVATYPYYKSVPYQAAESTAALVVYQQALAQAGTLERQPVLAALAKLHTTIFFGPIAFDAHGVNRGKPMAVEQLLPDGRTYTVFPVGVAERDALYPIPGWGER